MKEEMILYLKVNSGMSNDVEKDSREVDGQEVTEEPPAQHNENQDCWILPQVCLGHVGAFNIVLGQFHWSQVIQLV